MVSYIYKSNKKVRLTPEKRERICADINGKLTQYYKDLDIPKKDTQDILEKLFPDYNQLTDKIDKIPSIYEQYKTYCAAIRRACFPSYDAILDIEGQDIRSNNLAGTYKASLIYDWYNINLMSTLSDVLDTDWTIKGEAACYICWKEVINEIKEDNSEIVMDEEGLPQLVTNTTITPVETFAAVDVQRIDPHNLYFDKSQVKNWRSCPKIYRDFIPLETILADSSYDLTREEKEELKETVFSKGREQITNLYTEQQDANTKIIRNTVEVLEFEGDFIDPDTHEVYKNIEAIVVAGKYLAKFVESKKPQSSIIFASYMKRPDTGRGQSPLKIPTILNEVQNACADLMLASWKLQTYPTFLSPKGALPSYVPLEPGRPVEYDADTLSGQTPQQLNFTSGLRGFDFSDFFQRKMENATGINQYMQGAMDGSVRTASEASYIHSGASMRMSTEANQFSHNFLYPLVRTYALFKKVYDTADRTINVGDGVFRTVDAEVRSGNYTFIIGGSQSAIEREAETNKLFQLLSLPVFQSLTGLIDPYTAASFMQWILNRANFKHTNQVLEMLQLNGQIREIAQQLGIQDKNFAGFEQAMMDNVKDILPHIGQRMAQNVMDQQQ